MGNGRSSDLYLDSPTGQGVLEELYGPIPTVRILIYTDSWRFRNPNDGEKGTSIMRDLISRYRPFYAHFQIDCRNRNDWGSTPFRHATFRLTADVLSQYDEVWFFGDLQMNVTAFDMTFGGPENELSDEEIAALESWMDRGGVLMLGDHANPPPNASRPEGIPHSEWLNLGRALGRRVPRAGELRTWDGPPTYEIEDNFNTVVMPPPRPLMPVDANLDSDPSPYEYDSYPQSIILKTYGVTGLTILPHEFHPHPLFCGRNGPITVFPDHNHEGELLIPSSFDESVWPRTASGEQPRPEIIAWGTDKRDARGGMRYALVSAYDGDPAGVGRIVADSTWHHYVNVNLRGFRDSAGNPNATGLRLANYYVNLAAWLAPLDLRNRMRREFYWRVANHPAIMEIANAHIRDLGRAATNVLGEYASQCEILQFALLPGSYHRLLGVEGQYLPSMGLMLGGIIQQYHQAFNQAAFGKKIKPVEKIFEDGVRQAFKYHIESLQQIIINSKKSEEALFGQDAGGKEEWEADSGQGEPPPKDE